MSIAVDGIGLVGSVLGIWQFLTSLVPPQKQAASQYRIQVGVDGYQGLSNAGGNIDKIHRRQQKDQPPTGGCQAGLLVLHGLLASVCGWSPDILF